MSQSIDSAVWDLCNKAVEGEERKAEIKVKNGVRKTKGSWTDKIVSAIRISDLASEFGIDKCPVCSYSVQFDDSNGFFICVKAKYNHSCNFKGNIVDFQMRCGR